MGHDSVLYVVLIVLCGDVIKGSALPVTACVLASLVRVVVCVFVWISEIHTSSYY